MTVTTMERGTTIGDAIMVFKPRIAAAIMLSAIGGIAVADGPSPGLGRLCLVAIAVFLAAGSAGAFNQWIESDLDARMKRTASRPFVTGRFTAGPAWLAIIVGLLAAAVLLAGFATNWWAALYTFLGAFTYGVVYTMWLKRRSWTNIIIGGLAGSFAVHGRRRRRQSGARNRRPPADPGSVLVDTAAFLEPGHGLQRRLCPRRRPHASGGGR